MTCDELLQALNEYVDGTLDPGLCAQFQQHLEGCNPCQIVIDNIRNTIQLYKGGETFELPADLRARLRASLRERWKQSQQ
ncbi:MAG: anti-sigma factor family protein [Phycisphaerae bacterium]